MAWGVCPRGLRTARLQALFRMGISAGSRAESGSQPRELICSLGSLGEAGGGEWDRLATGSPACLGCDEPGAPDLNQMS